jgi:hypothetical protein
MTTGISKSSSPEAMNGPVFVVGMWRSGTSLLYALLNLHPQIALMYEGDLPLLATLFRGGKSRSDWAERWEFWNGALSRHNIDMPSIPREVAGLPAAMELVYRKYAGLAMWGCKSPNYYDCMVPLAKQFPGARFIVIYRDPTDVCRSIVRAGRKSRWFAKRGLPLRVILGYREMKREAERLASMGARVCELQYEDLVRDPAIALTGICRFLQIPYDARMVALEEADRSAIYNADHHAGVKGKKIAAAGKREEVLSAALRAKIRRYANLWQAEYGGMWPAHPAANNAETDLPGLIERSVDRLRYRALRSYDRAIASFYCVAPLGLLRAFRATRRQPAQSPEKTANSLQSVGAD